MSLHTCPPDRLQACTDKYLLRRLLASTPLNLPRVFLYALYFTLMPVAVLGPAAGVAGTAVLAGVAAYLWLWGTPAALDSFLWFWLVWSLVDWVLYLLFRLVLGIWEYRRARVYLAPDAAESAVDLHPGGRLEAEFAPGEDRKELVLLVPEQGIYVLSARVCDPDNRVDVIFDSHACMEEHELVPGLVNSNMAAYRLQAGCHCVSILVQSHAAAKMSISLRG